MTKIKTLDERIEDATGVTVTVAEQLEMSRAEVAELKQALADSNLALMEQTELADKCRKQAETLEAERDQARAELEEWRFTNKIDELQREVDRYRAAPQQHAQAALSDPLQGLTKLWPSMILPSSVNKPSEEHYCDGWNKCLAEVRHLLATRQPAPVALIPMGEEGDQWYFDCDGHYIDVKRDEDGKYSIYFRNRKDGSEAWHDQADAAPVAAAVQGDAKLSEAAFDVLAERERQIKAEGMERQYDDKYRNGELRRAAAVYAYPQVLEHDTTIWPWAQSWMKHTNPRRDAVKAAALLIAEIERIDRLAAQPHKKD